MPDDDRDADRRERQPLELVRQQIAGAAEPGDEGGDGREVDRPDGVRVTAVKDVGVHVRLPREVDVRVDHAEANGEHAERRTRRRSSRERSPASSFLFLRDERL